MRQSEWAARERKAPTGPEGKGELETGGKWPKSRVSARKGGFGPEEGGGDVKWAKGGGERRESEREHDFSELKKKKGRKAGAAGGQKEACSTEARVNLFYTGSGTREFCCRVARPSARSVCEARRSKRCKGPSDVSAGQRAASSCCKLSKSAPLHWRMCASSHRRTCLSRSTEERVAWEPAPAYFQILLFKCFQSRKNIFQVEIYCRSHIQKNGIWSYIKTHSSNIYRRRRRRTHFFFLKAGESRCVGSSEKVCKGFRHRASTTMLGESNIHDAAKEVHPRCTKSYSQHTTIPGVGWAGQKNFPSLSRNFAEMFHSARPNM